MDQAGAAASSPAVPAVFEDEPRPHRVAGVAVIRFALVDGRPAYQAWQAEEMVAAFIPDTVPLLTRHGGLPIGYLETLHADGADLHFTASVVDEQVVVKILQRGYPVSVEVARCPYPGEPARHATSRRDIPPFRYFRGGLAPGSNLVGVALSQRPAAPWSVAWLEAAAW
jgi:hypothetical protein